jgi:hypothetical protein
MKDNLAYLNERVNEKFIADGVWRIKNIDELYTVYKEPSIVKMIKTARLKWLGHIVRMEDNVHCMKIKFSEPEGSRKKGRPRLKWFDSV